MCRCLVVYLRLKANCGVDGHLCLICGCNREKANNEYRKTDINANVKIGTSKESG